MRTWKWEKVPASDDGWVYERELGSGTFGQVSLWVRYDEGGKIAERSACKEIALSEEDLRDISFNGPRRDQIRREALLHSQISAKDPRARHIVLYHGDDFFFQDKVHRIYIEYCPHGDLWEVKRRLFERKDKT